MHLAFFFTSKRRHTRLRRDWSSDVCSSDLRVGQDGGAILTVDGEAIIAPVEPEIVVSTDIAALFRCTAIRIVLSGVASAGIHFTISQRLDFFGIQVQPIAEFAGALERSQGGNIIVSIEVWLARGGARKVILGRRQEIGRASWRERG